MYLRTTQRKNKSGTTVRYVQLAHHRRINGTTQAEGVFNFGREDRLDTDGLLRLVASINRYLGEDGVVALPVQGPGAVPVGVDSSQLCGTLFMWRPEAGPILPVGSRPCVNPLES